MLPSSGGCGWGAWRNAARAELPPSRAAGAGKHPCSAQAARGTWCLAAGVGHASRASPPCGRPTATAHPVPPAAQNARGLHHLCGRPDQRLGRGRTCPLVQLPHSHRLRPWRGPPSARDAAGPMAAARGQQRSRAGRSQLPKSADPPLKVWEHFVVVGHWAFFKELKKMAEM